jgi:hypothetical protein
MYYISEIRKVSHCISLSSFCVSFQSFQRQLNIYGFRRIQDGPNRGGYYHPNFIRGSPALLKRIIRKRTSERTMGEDVCMTTGHLVSPCHISTQGAVASALSNPLPMAPAPITVSSTSSLRCQDMLLHPKTLLSPFLTSSAPSAPASVAPNDQLIALLAAATDDEYKKHELTQQNTPQLSPSVVAALNVATDVSPCNLDQPAVAVPSMNTTSDLAMTSNGAAAAIALSARQHIFPCKLYKVLEEGPHHNFSHILSWVDGGKSFKVHNTKEFVNVVMPHYFDQTKYER